MTRKNSIHLLNKSAWGNDLINIFVRQDLIKTDVQRSVEDSETFGKEYMIEMIFRKK